MKTTKKVVVRKRGAPKSKSTAEREKWFKKYKKEIIKNGRFMNSAAPIYKKLADRLGVEDKQTIYLHAKRYFGLSNSGNKSDNELELQSYENSGDYDQTFTIELGEVDIITDFVSSNVYVRGVRSFFRVITWHFSKYTCTWHFDVCHVVQNQLVCTGSCTEPECNAKVFFSTEKNRTVLRITLKDFNDKIIHSKKSYVTGEHKQRILKLLRVNTAYVVRSLVAADMVEEGQLEPGVLPNKDTLKTAKYRTKIRESNERLDADPVIAVAKMAHHNDTSKYIHAVAIHPFCVMYATLAQAALIRSNTKRERIVLSVDATGVSLLLSPIASKSEKTGKMKRCFLYVITLQSATERGLPLYQMLSQDHRSIQINNMMLNCKSQNNDFTPNEIVVDDSAALLLSSVTCFTEFNSVNKYLDYCFDIRREEDDSRAITYIRLDRSHIVKSIMQTVAVKKGVNKMAVTLYRRLLGFLIQQLDVDICEQVLL